MKYTPNLTRSELRSGLTAMVLCLFIFPGILTAALNSFTAAQINFTIYFVSAGLIVYLLRGYLLRNLKQAMVRPFLTIYYACLGYLAHLALSELATVLILLIDPAFLNLNDQTISAQVTSELGLMAITVVVLAPISEECFFRGLLLRGMYDRSPVLAWMLSMGLFAAVHVLGYIGSYGPLALVLAFLQYLPAGAALAFAYHRGGTIFCPILAHAIINGMAVYATMR